MPSKKRGRKPVNRSKEYERGYQTGWGRAMRKAKGEIPTTRKTKDGQRSNDWQDGLKNGIRAGKRFFGKGKVNRG